MFGFLDNQVVEVAISGVMAAVFLIFWWSEMPPATYRKTGKPRSWSNRWKQMSRNGKRFCFIGVLLAIFTVFGIVDIVVSH